YPGDRGKVLSAYRWARDWAGPDNEKKRWKHERFGLQVPAEPTIDAVCAEVLEAYHRISRGRQFIGMIGAPAPLSHRDIDAYLLRYPTAIPIAEFEAAVLALDDEYRAQWAAAQSESAEQEPGDRHGGRKSPLNNHRLPGR
ncbi:hypothetical protein, partial [Pseudomonas aeruginosa]|uniref:hypothetical protein n=1 Tax=Pseudomonas aeruginosa TaxID=287 RepID=UPI001573D29A